MANGDATQPVPVRLSAAEREALRRAAAERGKSVAAFLRDVVRDALGLPPPAVVCSECGRPFAWDGKHAPRPDRAIFCSDACRHEARKRSIREWARRHRAERSRAPHDVAGNGQRRPEG